MKTIFRKISGALIFSADQKLLLGQSRAGGVYKDMWTIPGGGIEEGETPIQGAVREVAEEVGIDIKDFAIKELPTSNGESQKIDRKTGEVQLVKMEFYTYAAYSEKVAKDIPFTCTDDLVDAQWFNFEQLQTLQIAPGIKQILIDMGILQSY